MSEEKKKREQVAEVLDALLGFPPREKKKEPARDDREPRKHWRPSGK